ncbi:hypothetical protein Pelo_7327 [Pelomyxa schiedti]|nr:hypothetical protein Pelo_7327 [Pelomyxa schiedti]
MTTQPQHPVMIAESAVLMSFLRRMDDVGVKTAVKDELSRTSALSLVALSRIISDGNLVYITTKEAEQLSKCGVNNVHELASLLCHADRLKTIARVVPTIRRLSKAAAHVLAQADVLDRQTMPAMPMPSVREEEVYTLDNLVKRSVPRSSISPSAAALILEGMDEETFNFLKTKANPPVVTVSQFAKLESHPVYNYIITCADMAPNVKTLISRANHLVTLLESSKAPEAPSDIPVLPLPTQPGPSPTTNITPTPTTPMPTTPTPTTTNVTPTPTPSTPTPATPTPTSTPTVTQPLPTPTTPLSIHVPSKAPLSSLSIPPNIHSALWESCYLSTVEDLANVEKQAPETWALLCENPYHHLPISTLPNLAKSCMERS